MYRKIICDWFLTDGIHAPIRLDSPMFVEDALTASGVIASDLSYEQHTAVEWIYRRTWRYCTDFKLPDAGERTFLRLSGLKGAWRVYINDALAAQGEGSAAEFEVTAGLEAQNRLEIRFDADGSGALRPVIGFSGMLSYRHTSVAAITGMRPTGEWQIAVDLDLSREAETELKFELKNSKGKREDGMSQPLNAGFTSLLFTGFDSDIVSGENNEIEVSAYVDGVKSDSCTMLAYLPEDQLLPRGFVGESEEMLSLGENAGAISAFTQEAEPSLQFRLMAARHGLESLSAEDFDSYTPPAALLPAQQLLTLSGGQEKLEGRELWLLTGSDPECYERAKALVPSGELEKVVAVSRYGQALALRQAALDARMNGNCFVIGSAEYVGGVPASSALSDGAGHMRPAYYALMGAWQGEYAYIVSAAGKDGIVSSDVYFVMDGSEPSIDAVSVGVYDISGVRCLDNSFPVLSKGSIGRFTFELPEGGCAVLRVTLVKGEESRVCSDEIVLGTDKSFEELPLTQLLTEDGKVINAGETAALGVCVPSAGYFGCLLPGEYVTASQGDPDEAEGLNIYM